MTEIIIKGIKYIPHPSIADYGMVDSIDTTAVDWSNDVVIESEVEGVPPIKLINDNAFKGCTSLTSIKLPDGIMVIGNNCFQNCSSLTTITIPVSTTYIYTNAFSGCSALATLYYKGTKANKTTRDTWTAIQGGGKSSLPNGVKKYLVNEETIALPDGSEMIKSTTNKDVVSAYAIKDVKGNQIDTYYMPASEKQTLEEIANGKCKSYAVESLDKIIGTVSADKSTITNVTAITGIEDLSVLKVGDVIFVKENDVPDYWVSNIAGTKDLTKLETVKVESTIIDKAFIEAIAAGSTPDVDLDPSAGIAHTKIYFKIPEAKGISSVEKGSTTGLVDTYKINYNTGTPDSFTVSNGRGITSISKEGETSAALVDTYKITFNNGDTTTYTVQNGNGIASISSPDTSGVPGTSDTYTINFTNGEKKTYVVANGNGIASITKLGALDPAAPLKDTYQITYNNGGTKTYDVCNGRGITSVNKDTSGLTDTYTITYNDGSAPTNIVVSNAKSITGISKVSGTGAAGTTDTYKITFNSGDPVTYNVYNGKDGASATIAAGTVTMGDVGSTPTVTNSGTALNAVFDFNIPKSQTISYDSTNKILTITSV